MSKDPHLKMLAAHSVGKMRLPGPRDFVAALQVARSSERLHRDPLKAIGLMVERDPDLFFQ